MAGAHPTDDFQIAELTPVGAHYCLFRPDNHAVGLLDPRSAQVWQDCRNGRSTDTVITAAAKTALMETWRDGGFCTQLHRSTGWTDAMARVPETSSTLGRYALTGRGLVAVHCEDAHLSTLLAAVLAPLATGVGGTADSSISITSKEPGSYSIWLDATELARTESASSARHIALQAILLALHGRSAVSAILHASGITIGDRAALLAGSTGSGKSTLAAGLVAAGAGYLGDDLIGLSVGGTDALAFPIALSAKAGSWSAIDRSFPTLGRSPDFVLGARTVRYISFDTFAAEQRCAFETGAIVFPCYTSGQELEAVRLSPEQTLSRLIASGTEITGDPRSVLPLAKLVNRTPAFALGYGRTEDAVRWVLELEHSY